MLTPKCLQNLKCLPQKGVSCLLRTSFFDTLTLYLPHSKLGSYQYIVSTYASIFLCE
uniref:Uncharacterized protein n=1 Tax=Arundo donax TaxID=35708 RepID=A0A0A9DTW1_ARUDO